MAGFSLVVFRHPGCRLDLWYENHHTSPADSVRLPGRPAASRWLCTVSAGLCLEQSGSKASLEFCDEVSYRVTGLDLYLIDIRSRTEYRSVYVMCRRYLARTLHLTDARPLFLHFGIRVRQDLEELGVVPQEVQGLVIQ